jgi:hypothetical protein
LDEEFSKSWDGGCLDCLFKIVLERISVLLEPFFSVVFDSSGVVDNLEVEFSRELLSVGFLVF